MSSKLRGMAKFYPEAPKHIIAYLQRHFPNFTYRRSSVKEIFIDQMTGKPLEVTEENPSTGECHRTQVETLFGSPGHSNVLRYDPKNNTWKKMWHENLYMRITNYGYV